MIHRHARRSAMQVWGFRITRRQFQGRALILWRDVEDHEQALLLQLHQPGPDLAHQQEG